MNRNQGQVPQYQPAYNFPIELQSRLQQLALNDPQEMREIARHGRLLEREAQKSNLRCQELYIKQKMRQIHEEIVLKEDARVFIKYEGDIPIGFAQCQLRHDYVEGAETSPVGYLEGIFVKEGYRHKGYAKELLLCCEDWARIKVCKEFASDCELDNAISLKFHKAVGFTEANRIICFTKKL